MLHSSAHLVTTGARLRQFVLDLLRARGLTEPATWQQGPALDAYLSSLWHVAHSYRDRPFEFYFVAELLEKAFDYPPMPYDWEPALRQPYHPTPDHVAPYQTPAYYAEGDTYFFFERRIKRQILEIKLIKLHPPINPWGEHRIGNHELNWQNLSVESFLERGTSSFEEEVEIESTSSWRDLSIILREGQLTE